MQTCFDMSQPELTDQVRTNYVEGFHLLQTDPVQDQTNTSAAIPLELKIRAKALLYDKTVDTSLSAIQNALNYCIAETRGSRSISRGIGDLMEIAFRPLQESAKTTFPSFKVSQSTGFDGPITTIATDIAPYIRSIVSYDIQLEERRLRLSTLLSPGGRNGKKLRTTRASRAALEGGSKANTRRERWFPKNTSYSLVLETGGRDWQNLLLQQQHANEGEMAMNREASEGDTGSYDGSRRSSIVSF